MKNILKDFWNNVMIPVLIAFGFGLSWFILGSNEILSWNFVFGFVLTFVTMFVMFTWRNRYKENNK